MGGADFYLIFDFLETVGDAPKLVWGYWGTGGVVFVSCEWQRIGFWGISEGWTVLIS
jgi:hypothetical protein